MRQICKIGFYRSYLVAKASGLMEFEAEERVGIFWV